MKLLKISLKKHPHTFFLFICTLLFTSMQAQPAPSWFVYPGTPSAGRFDDIFFVNDTTGWCVNSDGQIFKTINAGKDWHLQLFTGDYFRSIEFFDDQIGFAGSLFGSLYKTIDGGENWYDIADSLPHAFSGICGMSVADDSTIYICGVWSSPAYVFKSSDRGHSWSYTDMSGQAYSLVDMKFTDKDHGFVTGQSDDLDKGGIILYTDDGGANWTQKIITDYPNDYVWKIQLLDDNLHMFGAIANVSAGYKTRFLSSEDAGATWSISDVKDDYYYIEMCGFMNKDTGWTGSSVILETFDGGETWHENTFGYNFDRFFKVNDNLAFASASTIHVYSDTSYVAPVDTTVTDTTITDTTLALADVHPTHSILSILPNPAHDHISVNYEIVKRTTIDLSIFDMQGHLLKRVYHGMIAAGQYTQSWDNDLPAGQYMLCMHSNEGLTWKQFAVQ